MSNYVLSNIQAAYIAGIVDGEGYIGISKFKAPSGNFVYRVQVEIGMCDLQALRYISKCIKHKLLTINRNKQHKRTIYRIRLTNHIAVDFLQRIRKFVLVKSEQIELCVKLQNNVDKSTRRTNDKRLTTERTQEFRNNLWERCCHLNSG